MKRNKLFVFLLAIIIALVPTIILAEDTNAIFGLEEEVVEEVTPKAGDRVLSSSIQPGEEETAVPTKSVNSDYTHTNNSSSNQNNISSSSDNIDKVNVVQLKTNNTTSSNDPIWAEGSIELDFGWISPDTYRNSMQYPRGRSISWFSLPYYSGNVSADLYDSNGNLVESNSGEARHVFTGLKADTYTIRLTVLDQGIYFIVESIVNGGPIPHLITSYESTVEIVEGNTSIVRRWVALEYKAYGFKTTTDLGTFENGGTEKVYYTGENYSFANNDPSTNKSYPSYNTHNGIYWGDSANQYSGMNTLEEPTLSDAEINAGIKFLGWKLVGDPSDKIYTTEQALSIVVKKDIELIAQWSEGEEFTVTFSTNTDLGLINGKDSYSYKQKYIDGPLSDIPTPVAKEGFEFIGWFNDLTVNTIPDSELRSTYVDQDLNFYAKYRRVYKKYSVIYEEGEHGTLEGTVALSINENNFIPTVPTVNPEDGYIFLNKWKVVSIDDNDLIQVGDVLTEIQLSRLQINYNLTVEALYEKEEVIDICNVCGMGGDTKVDRLSNNNVINKPVSRSVKGVTTTVKTGDTNTFDYNYIILLLSTFILFLVIIRKELNA